MSRENSPSSNIFIRFKHHVDANVASAVNTVFKSPVAPPEPEEASTTTPRSCDTMGSLDMDTSWPADKGNGSLSSIVFSSYSPLALRSLPQPVPNDAPPNVDPKAFTFEDAFEDLLAVSKGQPLPDITSRYEQRKLLRSMFPEGEPAWFWMRRLRSQGLLESPNRGPLLRLSNSPDWDTFHRELDRRAANVWRAATGESEDETDEGGIFSELGHVMKKIDQGILDSYFSHSKSLDNHDAEDGQQQRRDAENFDDFFSSIHSTFQSGQKSWDAFIKTITESQSARLQKPSTVVNTDQTKQTVIDDEYVDRFGYLHKTVTVKTFDEDGNEIGKETRISVRPANKQPEDRSEDQASSQHTAIGHEGEKSGWFWK